MDKLAFTTSIDTNFIEGAVGLVKSIRRFHGDEPDIVIFIDWIPECLAKFAQQYRVELHTFDSIESWVSSLIYTDPKYLNDSSHFYHPDFYIRPGWPDHTTNRVPGLGIHHLHPLNCKAYCTGFCLCVRKYKHVIHIDADAFLLSNVSSLFKDVPEDTVIAFTDGRDDLSNLEKLYAVKKPAAFRDTDYAFNAGVVFYSNGPGVRELARDFMFFVDSCYHYTHAGIFADQGVLRSLVAKHAILGNIKFVLRDRTNWNPTWNAADDIYMNNRGEWINRANNEKQFIWHGAGAAKLWSGNYTNTKVLSAWQWVCDDGREFHLSFELVTGSLTKENCESMCGLIREKIGDRRIRIFEIGTQFGRTAIAFAQRLNCERVDTVDTYAPSDDFPVGHSGLTTEKAVAENIRRCGLTAVVNPHKTDGKENLLKRFPEGSYDVVFIDGDHNFTRVVSDCVVAQRLISSQGIIVGDDFHLAGVREAARIVFGEKPRDFAANMWYALI